MRSAFRPFRVLQRQIDRAIASYESGCCNAADLRVFARSASSAADAKIYAAIILERLPVITPDPPEWEVEYQTWKATRDAPYFKRMPSELTEMRNLGGEGGDEDEREDAAEASEDEEGPGLGRKQRYEPALRWTSADETGDVHSLERALDQRLFMLVRAAGKDAAWKFPHAAHGGAGETMRGAAGRALDAALAPDAELQTWFVGRSPCMHHACPAGWTATGGGQGAGAAGGASTLFFHRAQLIRGVPALRAGSGLVEFVWLTKAELGTRLADADLVSQLQKAL